MAVFSVNSRKSATCDVAQTVKNLPATQLTLVRSLGWEDSLEKRMASILLRARCCLGLPMDRGPWQATIRGVTKSRTQLATNTTSTRKSKDNFAERSDFATQTLSIG